MAAWRREAPDLTARICGICPVAYQMSSTHAIERALGIQITPDIRALRRLLYCGEWIESHGLHVYMLHAGLPRQKRRGGAGQRLSGLVRDGLELKKPATKSCACSVAVKSIRSTFASVVLSAAHLRQNF